jgi:DNA-binding IclR family transcriptional regulator
MAENAQRTTTGGLTIQSSLERIRAEYQEMPGLRLTPDQVARLCGVERSSCEQLLEALVDTRYLERSTDGRYARPADTRGSAGAAIEQWRRPLVRARSTG